MSGARTRLLLGAAFLAAAAGQTPAPSPEWSALQNYFERTAQARFERLFSGFGRLVDWQAHRARLGRRDGGLLPGCAR